MTDIVYPGKAVSATLGTAFLPKNVNLEIYRGDYFSIQFMVKTPEEVPVPLNGYAATAQIRPVYDSSIHYDFVVDITPEEGKIIVALESETSQSIPIGDYIWDFEITDPLGKNRTYLTGDVTLIGDVTDV